jgi:release factor glutamine methyltransferase
MNSAGMAPVRPLGQLIGAISGRLAAAGIEGARAEAWLLLGAACGRERADLVAAGKVTLGPEQELRLEALVARRAAREPLAYILGEKEFWSLPLGVGPGVLVPRPDSETVVEAALALVPDRGAPLRILDLGTGSCCLLLALLSELPQATGLGVDSSEAALAAAAENARRLGLEERARLMRGDWGRGIEARFDLIVCNPPYIAEPEFSHLMPEVRDHEPPQALLAGPDGLDAYRALAPDVARLLVPDGVACLELGQGQGPAVAAIMAAAGLETLEVRPDLAGIGRCLVAAHRTKNRQQAPSA